MPRIVEPSQQDLEAAFVCLRQPDWPASLHDLIQAAIRYGTVLATARHIANGGQVSRKPDITELLSTPVRTFEHPARREGVRPFPARRRDDHAVDLKSRAAGEKPDQE